MKSSKRHAPSSAGDEKGRKMTRKLKTLGLASVAALTLTLIAAVSPASAEFFYFSSEAEHTTLKGAQVGSSSFESDGGSVSCESATFNGTVPDSTVVEVTVDPAYEECTGLGGFTAANVDMNGCAYLLLPRTKEGSNFEAEVDIECEKEGESITLTAQSFGTVKCIVHIDEQQGLGAVTVSEEGSPSEILVSLNLTGIAYDQTAGSGFGACGKAENTTNGTYEGTVLVAGYVGETQVGINQVAQKPKIEFIPKEIDFESKGVGTIRKFQMKNISNENLEVIQLSKSPEFEPQGKCQFKVLAKGGGTCPEEEEVKCLKAKMNAFITVEFHTGYIAAIRAKKC
jgi:hypothetical protein